MKTNRQQASRETVTETGKGAAVSSAIGGAAGAAVGPPGTGAAVRAATGNDEATHHLSSQAQISS